MRTQSEYPMKSLAALVVIVTVMSLAPPHAVAGDIRIVANASVKADAVSAEELKRLYLEERASLRDGAQVEPVLQKRGTAHDVFIKEFLDLNDDALLSYYRTLVFTGRGSMPKTLPSDAAVVAYVARTRGAIGYVSSATNTEGVKILTLVSAEHRGERALLTRVEPDYPETMQRLHVGGTVRLQLVISPRGTVESAVVLGGNPILAEAAVKAAKQWVYAASPSRTTAEVTIPFAARR